MGGLSLLVFTRVCEYLRRQPFTAKATTVHSKGDNRSQQRRQPFTAKATTVHSKGDNRSQQRRQKDIVVVF